MMMKVDSVSTGVISNDSLPYQSRGFFETGSTSSCPHAWRLYPFHACRSSCFACSASAGSAGAARRAGPDGADPERGDDGLDAHPTPAISTVTTTKRGNVTEFARGSL